MARYNGTSETLAKAAEATTDQRIIDDLGAIFGAVDTAVGEAAIDDLGSLAQTHVPSLLAKLHALRTGGIGPHIPRGDHDRIHHMIGRFEQVVAKNMRLEAELANLNASSNVVLSTPFDNVPSLTTSAVCQFGTPYSGIDFMILACLLPAELTPAGRLATLNFMGIDFANPSINPVNVSYSGVTPGTQGVPVVQGMGVSNFYTNLTAPNGPRTFQPWTGWVFDASARISFSVYNPSGSFPATYLFDWLMKASPCPGQNQFNDKMARGHVRYHDGIAELMNAIHGFAIGIGRNTHSAEHAPLRSGYHMAAGHPSAAQVHGVLQGYGY
jgi:hypothetical protein